jgi:hypothetical protein
MHPVEDSTAIRLRFLFELYWNILTLSFTAIFETGLRVKVTFRLSFFSVVMLQHETLIMRPHISVPLAALHRKCPFHTFAARQSYIHVKVKCTHHTQSWQQNIKSVPPSLCDAFQRKCLFHTTSNQHLRQSYIHVKLKARIIQSHGKRVYNSLIPSI